MRIIKISLLLIILMLTRASAQTNNTYNEGITFTNDINNYIYFLYPDTSGDLFLRQLRQEYDLMKVINGCETDLKKLCAITDWTSRQWKHSGTNTPSKDDALTILMEAKQGKSFRCVEYGIVLSSALNAIGIKSRVLALKTKDVETTETGAGHVVAEAFIADLNKWVMADAQFNIVPTCNEIPLNAVEFQKTITSGQPYIMINHDGNVNSLMARVYLNFIYKYLYYFDTPFDNSPGISAEKLKINYKARLMLVPAGVKRPAVFQKKDSINYCIYTNSVNDFYKIPD